MTRSEWDLLVSCNYRDVHSVYMILKRNWKALLKEAEFLMWEGAKHGQSATTPWMRSQGWAVLGD